VRAREETARATTLEVAKIAVKAGGAGIMVARVAYELAQDAAWMVEFARLYNAEGELTLGAILATDDATEEARQASYHERLSGSGSPSREQAEKTAAVNAAARCLIASLRARYLATQVQQEALEARVTRWQRQWKQNAEWARTPGWMRKSGK
jgi:hypothetical protein